MSRSILLADDSVTIQKVVELTFVDEGYRVAAAGNGADAAARLAEVEPDLVIADVHMPALNGYDLCRRVKEWRREVPVLLLVGTFEPFDKDEYAACGAQGFLKKPFDSQELLRQAEELLRAAAPAPPAPPEMPLAAVGAAGAGEDLAWGNLDFEEAEPAAVGEESSYSALPETAAWEPASPADLEAWRHEEEEEEVAAEPAPAADLDDTASDLAAPAPAGAPVGLSEEDVDRVARRVVEILSEKVVREVSWEVVPDLAEVLIKDRIRELEQEVE